MQNQNQDLNCGTTQSTQTVLGQYSDGVFRWSGHTVIQKLASRQNVKIFENRNVLSS